VNSLVVIISTSRGGVDIVVVHPVIASLSSSGGLVGGSTSTAPNEKPSITHGGRIGLHNGPNGSSAQAAVHTAGEATTMATKQRRAIGAGVRAVGLGALRPEARAQIECMS
jgi:hypothetical protein